MEHVKKHHMPAIHAAVSGGVIFGILMGIMGMLPMVAQLVGSESGKVGFVVHVIISIILGFIYLAMFGHITKGKPELGATTGILFGIAWWFLGALLIMPLILMGEHMLTAEGMKMAMPSFWGHVVFGYVLGHVYSLYTK